MKTVPILLLFVFLLCLIQSASITPKNNLSAHSQNPYNKDFNWDQSAQYAKSMRNIDEEEDRNDISKRAVGEVKNSKVKPRRKLDTNGESKNTHGSETGPVGASNNDSSDSSGSDSNDKTIIISCSIIGAIIFILLIYFIKKRCFGNQSSSGENNQRLSNSSKQSKRTAIFIGESGSGKSSLLNKLFDLKLAIGMGDCTKQIQKIKQSASFLIYDSKGVGNDSMIGDSVDWSQFLKFDLIFVVYDASLKKIDKCVKYLIQNKSKRLYFVRNKCDNFNDKQMLGLDRELERDKQLLQDWGWNNPVIYCTSIPKKDQGKQIITPNIKERTANDADKLRNVFV